MMMQPGSEGVAQESDNLSILGDQPTSYTPTPFSARSRDMQVSYDKAWSRKDVSMDEFITTLRKSQMETLDVLFHNTTFYRGSSTWDGKRRLEVIEAVSTCESLKKLCIRSSLDVEEMEVLCENLASHPRLATLEVNTTLAGNSGDKGMEIVCYMLKNNRTVKKLNLFIHEPLTEIGLASLGVMLSVNSTLEALDVFANKGTSETGVEVALAPLTGHDGKPPLNKSLKKLRLIYWEIGQRGARAAAHMLRTNDSLTHLGLEIARFSDPSDVCTILESLETNETLHTLDLSNCKAVRGDVVLAKMMDLLRANHCLKKINLLGTPLERSGHAVQVKAQLKMNSRHSMAVVKGMPQVQPKFPRVSLCRDGYSSKRLNQFLNKIFIFTYTCKS